jgi:2-polyprenyl-6-methoxyphenol hydroxylase-like FAD-dependent oxidoreductase
MTEQRRVIVIGAGVGGLSAAIALQRAGIAVSVFERRADPAAIASGGGFILWNNAIKALRQIDLADAVVGAGATLSVAEWYSPRGRPLASWPIAAISASVGEPAVGISRLLLQSALVRAVEPGVLDLGAECTGFSETRDGVVVRFSDGREEIADALIGADGINSIVRSQLTGGWSAPRYAGVQQRFGITKLPEGTIAPPNFVEIAGRGLRFFTVPVSKDEVYWASAMRAPRGRSAAPMVPALEKSRLLSRFSGWMEPVESLIAGTDDDAVHGWDIVDRDPITTWGRGRATLLGDAAHPITPNLGQGACQAIEDAVVLAKFLAGATDVAQALRAYEASRVRRTNSFVRRSRMIGRIGRWSNPLACLARENMARVAIPGPALRQHTRDMAYEF